jgi:GT2 family glycosyltransferase
VLDQPQLSIVVPVLGNYGVLERVLNGFEHQDAPAGSFELVVVCDRAEPEPQRVRATVGTRHFRVRVVEGAVAGASGSRNTGWSAAAAPIVLFTDSDTVPTRGLVSEHLKWHRRWPAEHVVVVGLVSWARELKVSPFMKWLEQGVQFDYDGIQGTEASWAHVYSSNSSIKRSFLNRVGGFDEARLPYGYEDLDWGYRAREHGLEVLFNEQAAVEHWRLMTVEDWQARAPRLAVSEWRFGQLHPDVPPWFHRMFTAAAAHPPGGRGAAALTRVVPRRTPWLGPRLWDRATLHWRQQIAPHFLAAWNAALAGDPPPLQPAASALRERGANPGGS